MVSKRKRFTSATEVNYCQESCFGGKVPEGRPDHHKCKTVSFSASEQFCYDKDKILSSFALAAISGLFECNRLSTYSVIYSVLLCVVCTPGRHTFYLL